MRYILQRTFLQFKICLQNVSSPSILIKHYSFLSGWKAPEGYDCGIVVYNSAINKKVPLILTRTGIATWYICGPTVYAESHIGHACCYVKCDIIRRIMENIFNINVLLLMGITDVDDKIINKSFETKLSPSRVAKKYEFEFFDDMAAMQVQPPTVVSRVTENITLIITFCEKLIEKGFAYITDEGNVYFIVSKSSTANMFNEIPEDSQVIIDPFKKDKRDFALWKSAKPGEPYWPSPWGKGRPGWHIECSVMASDIFGCKLDIHSGGNDLIFPHHTNEKSQSEAFHDCSQWVNYWLHSGLLHVENDVKMSKSIKNTISIKDFLKDNCVNDFRILCLQSLYRKNISYCAETIEGAKGLHKKLHNFVNDCELYIGGNQKIPCHYEVELISKLEMTKEKIVALLADDFNTNQALLCLGDLIDEVNLALQASSISSVATMQGTTAIAACLNYVNQFLEKLGVKLICKMRLKREFIYFVDKTVEFRNIIRLYALCQIENEGSPISDFVTEAYKNIEASKPHNLKVLSETIENISYDVNIFYKESLAFVSTISSLESQVIKHPSSNDKNILQATKKSRAHMLSLCDNLRSSLQMQGIAIKDKKDTSAWFPLMSLKT